MQLPQPTAEIPELGGLVPSRLSALAEQGIAARREVDALLGRARRRARGLAVLRAAALLAAGAAVAVCIGALLGSFAPAAVARAAAALLLLASVAGIVVFSLRSPLQRAAARDDTALARLLAGSSELLSSVELSRAPEQPGISRDLLSLLHVRAAGQARALDVPGKLPLRSAGLPLAVLAGALIAAGLFQLAAPRRFALGLSRLRGGDAATPAPELSPIVGDLTITYLYPQYTGLPARTEEGTAGDLRAPRGTETHITARADRDLAEAAAVVNGKPVKLLSQGPGRRQLSGSFTLTQPGRWSFRFLDSKGRTIAQGPERPIEILGDQPPQVTLEAPSEKTLEVDPQGRVVLNWSATDDYGVSQVALLFQLAGGKEERVVLQTPGQAARRLRGTYSWELSPLRLRAGDKVTYAVEARDNDAVDGPQRGASATQVLKVFSAAEHSREALLRAQALWERLVGLAADRMEEKPAPPTDASGWYATTGSSDQRALQLVSELQAAGTALIKDKLAPREVGRALRYAASSLGPAVRRTSLARAPLSRGSSGLDGAQRNFARALSAEIAEEEKDILYLQDLLDKARLEAMQEIGKELAASRRELARLADRLRKAPDEETKRQILSEVERMRERIQDLMARMQEMARGIRDEHLNAEAMENVERQQDLLSQLSDIQRKLQSGKVDEALKQLDQLGQDLEKLEKGLAQRAQDEQGGQYSEEAQKLSQAAQKLRDVTAREKALQQRTAQLRREMGAHQQKRFDQRGGKDLARRLREKVEQARQGVKQIDSKLAERMGLEDVLEAAQSRVDDLSRALESGDFSEALEQAERSLRAVETLQARLGMEEQLAQRYPGFVRDPEAVKRGMKGVQGAAPPLREVVSELEQTMPRGQPLSPEQMQEMFRQQAEQRKIGEDLQQARNQLGEVGRKVPIFGPQHEQMLQQAQEGMGRAEQRLGQGEPRGAQAGEEQALEQLQRFEDAMQQMAKQAGGKGQSGPRMPMPWGEPSGDQGENDSGDMDTQKVEIPDAEAGRGPQEFRKELLDAMKQKAPEKYQERVKQYYEELVK
jgi:hypothetical protein